MPHRPSHIVFHLGGPPAHPVAEQAYRVSQWLGTGYTYGFRESRAAFEDLDGCDLLVLMGTYWTQSPGAEWAGRPPYEPLEDHHMRAFEAYVVSGRPLLVHHGAILSYDDRPRFGELRGFTWEQGHTAHPPFATFTVNVLPTGHPVVAGVDSYAIDDELYYNVRVTPGLDVLVHATAEWGGAAHPMVMTAEGGRTPGAGRLAYLANGHDMRAFAAPALRRLWVNTVHWLLREH
jgi:type 1 glutamine amidotransferase